MARKKSPEERVWDIVSGESHGKIAEMQKTIKGYSYRNREISASTDEKICGHFIRRLARTKKLLFSISDTCFSLQAGEKILPLTDIMRDEVDILSDEIKVRHCEWKDIPPAFLNRLISHDLKMVKGLRKVNKNLEAVFRGIVRGAKKGKKDRDLWKKARKSLLLIRKQIRGLAILFRERETLCNIHPLTLERSFRKMQQEIREVV
jgi:hypothetical protein